MRSKKRTPHRLVDLFAGPGGLGEGFASARDEFGRPLFQSVASIERDEYSHRTLFLRHFYRSFPQNEIPVDYYDYLKGGISLEELYQKHPAQYEKARRCALRISLGLETHKNVREIIDKGLGARKKWALIGGPPCQAYSLVGRSRMMGKPDFESDERHFLYQEYLKIIIDHQPPVFVMENVKGLLSAKVSGKVVINRIVSDLSHPRKAFGSQVNGLQYKLYSLSEAELPTSKIDPKSFLVKAEEYGVPQARHRMFIVGIRSDLDIRPRQLRRHAPPTVRETIGNLPRIRSGLSKGVDSADNWRREIGDLSLKKFAAQLNEVSYTENIISELRIQLGKIPNFPKARSSSVYPRTTRTNHKVLHDIFDPQLSVLTGHESRGHMASDLRRYFFASVFAKVNRRTPKLSDFPLSLLPDHRNVELGRAGKMFSDRFRVQLPDQVSTTITSHISKDGHYFIHPDPAQCRSLTVREAARLQTFPDNYKFEGPRTSQYHQVGNAVPPYLAGQIAEIIAEVLDSMKG